MAKNRQFRCWSCNSFNTIKWGSQNGKQRYKCKECGLLSTRSNSGVRKKNREHWFREWIIGKQTFEQVVIKEWL